MTITGYRRIGVRIDSVQVIKLRVKLWGGTFSTILHLDATGASELVLSLEAS